MSELGDEPTEDSEAMALLRELRHSGEATHELVTQLVDQYTEQMGELLGLRERLEHLERMHDIEPPPREPPSDPEEIFERLRRVAESRVDDEPPR